MNARKLRSSVCLGALLMVCAFNSAELALGEWISSGDYVVTVTETQVMDGPRPVTVFETGSNFRVHSVNGSWVACRQELDGEFRSGWVKKTDVLKLNSDQRAVYATKDTLIPSQGQTLKLAKGRPITIKYESDHFVDIFVVSEEGKASYKWVAKNGYGHMSSRFKQWNTRTGSFKWTPPDDDQYYLLIDNTDFPDGGANSRRGINYKLAYCVEDPKPDEPSYGKGLIIGRVTLDYDGFRGRHERCSDPFTVLVDCIDEADDVKTLKAQVDQDGYFFLANVRTNRKYRVQKLDGPTFEAPIGGIVTSSFRGEKQQDKWVHDVGCFSLRVTESGKVEKSVDAPDFSCRTMPDGSTQVSFQNGSSPLDRHQWFLAKFPHSGWAERVAADRQAIYEEREEAARKKKEKERKKQEELRQQEAQNRGRSNEGSDSRKPKGEEPGELDDDVPQPPEVSGNGDSESERARDAKGDKSANGTSEPPKAGREDENPDIPFEAMLAVMAYKEGDYDKTIELADKALAIAPDSHQVLLLRGRVRLSKGEPEKALADLTKAVQLDPENGNTLFHRASAYILLKHYQEAIADLNKTLELDGDEAPTYYSRAVAKRDSGDARGAIEDYTQTIRLDPSRDGAYVGRAICCLTINQYDKAITDCDAALEVNPENEDAHGYRALAKFKLKDYRGTAADADEAIARGDNAEIVYYVRGASYLEIERFDEALRDANKVVDMKPESSANYLLRARVYAKMGELTKAKADFERARELDSRQA